MEEKLVLKFDPNTIEHLGISLYSKLPSVISELISNSWDADADKVVIDFRDNGTVKEIFYSDNGEGMTFSELNEKYLLIGRNRRAGQVQNSSKGRKVIGKKGLGKLSVFGICDIIEVRSTKTGVENHFRMNINDIKTASSSRYFPNVISENIHSDQDSGTDIWLKEIRRKSGFDIDNIALSLSKKFLIFDRLNVRLLSNGVPHSEVTNDLKYSDCKIQFTWDFPNLELDSSYEQSKLIGGKIYTLETPVKDTEMKGIYLTSRGKIVNTASFYGVRDTDQFHSYATGYLEVDFIDDFSEDVISTDRHSLNWENDQTRRLQEYLQTVIKKIGNEWKKKRATLKAEKINSDKNLNIEKWQNALPTYEKDLSDKIIGPILENSNIDVEESSVIIGNVIDKFDNKVFKDYASKIADISTPEEIPMLLELMEDWKAIEAKQYRDLAFSRIEVIKQFEDYITSDAKEVPTLHGFLKKFSWLLDPRILEFKDEVTYSKLLDQKFPKENQLEKNRRIDFLCSNALGEILYVIEIKRSQFVVDADALEQAFEYGVFLRAKYATGMGFSKVVCYVIGGSRSSSDLFKSKEQTYSQTGQVFVKTYHELLEQSKQYHKEFIEAYQSNLESENK